MERFANTCMVVSGDNTLYVLGRLAPVVESQFSWGGVAFELHNLTSLVVLPGVQVTESARLAHLSPGLAALGIDYHVDIPPRSAW